MARPDIAMVVRRQSGYMTGGLPGCQLGGRAGEDRVYQGFLANNHPLKLSLKDYLKSKLLRLG